MPELREGEALLKRLERYAASRPGTPGRTLAREAADALTASQEQNRQAEFDKGRLVGELVASQERERQLREALEKARPYVVEHGPPGTGIETTEESAERSAALLIEIDAALDRKETQ